MSVLPFLSTDTTIFGGGSLGSGSGGGGGGAGADRRSGGPYRGIWDTGLGAGDIF